MRLRAIVPVKDFADAKARLASVRTPQQRALLAQQMAGATLTELADFDPLVACDTDAVEQWARSLGVETIRTPAGLNNSLRAAMAGAGAGAVAGTELVAICHADLAFPAGLSLLLATARPLIVSDRHGLGTNVMVVPSNAGFDFAYGPDSFHLHRAEATRLDIDLEVIDDERLAWDVDTADDLDTPSDWGPPSWLT